MPSNASKKSALASLILLIILIKTVKMPKCHCFFETFIIFFLTKGVKSPLIHGNCCINVTLLALQAFEQNIGTRRSTQTPSCRHLGYDFLIALRLAVLYSETETLDKLGLSQKSPYRTEYR